MRTISARGLAACFLVLAPFSVVLADVVVLKSGDRITGDVLEIWDNDVIVEPLVDDDVNMAISLSEVDYIESERTFEVTLRDGREVDMKLVGKARGGQQLIEINGQRSAVSLDQIEELDEIDDYFDWESRIDFSLSLNRGNTDSLNTRLFGETKLKLGDHRHLADLTLTREEQDNATTRDSDLIRYSYNWLFSDPWFLGGQASGERDPIRDLEYRFIAGATIGRDIFNKPRIFMNAQAGFGYLTEKQTPTDTNTGIEFTDKNDSVAFLWAFRWRQDFIGDDLELYHNNSVSANLTGRSNTSIKTTTGLRFEITDLLYLNASVDYDYETEPSEGSENEDLAIVVGLGLEFD